jgi:hypothetical protein
MRNFERGDAAFIVSNFKGGRHQVLEGKVIASGAKWVTVEYVLAGHRSSQKFDTRTRCLQNFGDVSKIRTAAEHAAATA